MSLFSVIDNRQTFQCAGGTYTRQQEDILPTNTCHEGKFGGMYASFHSHVFRNISKN